MAVRAEARSGLHAILVDDAQRTEFDVVGIEVVGEGKSVEGLEPTVVGKPSLIAASDLVHENLLGHRTWGWNGESKGGR